MQEAPCQLGWLWLADESVFPPKLQEEGNAAAAVQELQTMGKAEGDAPGED